MRGSGRGSEEGTPTASDAPGFPETPAPAEAVPPETASPETPAPTKPLMSSLRVRVLRRLAFAPVFPALGILLQLYYGLAFPSWWTAIVLVSFWVGPLAVAEAARHFPNALPRTVRGSAALATAVGVLAVALLVGFRSIDPMAIGVRSAFALVMGMMLEGACLEMGVLAWRQLEALLGVGAEAGGAGECGETVATGECGESTWSGEIDSAAVRVAVVQALSAALAIAFTAAVPLAVVVVTAGVAVCVSMAALTVLASRTGERVRPANLSAAEEGPGRPAGSADLEDAEGYLLVRQHAERTCQRLAVSFGLMGFSCAIMIYLFMAAPYERLATGWWLVGVAGVVIGAMLLLAGRAIAREWAPLTSLRLAALPALVAFFPFEVGDSVTMHVAITSTLVYVMSTFAVAPLVVREFDQALAQGGSGRGCVGRGCPGRGEADRRRAGDASAMGLGAGVAAGLLIGCALVQLTAFVDASVFGIVMEIAAIVAIGCVYAATNFVVNAELLRDARLLARRMLPLSYQVYEPLDASDQEEQELRGRILACCKRLAFEKGLTARETEVLSILARGSSLARVQEDLCISEGTAATHRSHIYRKLGINSRQELIDLIDRTAREAAEE